MVSVSPQIGLVAWAGLLLLLAAPAQAQEQGQGASAGRMRVVVFAAVEGRTAVVFAVPKGALVKKEELVCELDATRLKERLANQETIIAGSEADLRGARLAREAAEVAATEYLDGAYKNEFETVQGEIALADAQRKRAEDRLVWSDRMYDKGFVSKAENVADKISLQQKIYAFEQAQTRKAVLEKYIRDRTIKERRSEVEKRKAVELAAQAALQRAQTTRDELSRQIGRCKIFAPVAGRIRWIEPIEPGAIVQEGQLLFRIVPVRTPGEAVK